MTLAASNAFINWHSVVITPTIPSASPVTLTNVTDIKRSREGSPEELRADDSVLPTIVAVPNQSRKVTITTADTVTAESLVVGNVFSIVAVLDDSVNRSQAAGGGYTYTWANAVLVSNPFAASHGKFGSADLEFECYSIAKAEPMTKVAL